MSEETKGVRIRPLGERIIVKRDRPQEETRGGIIIPDMAKEKQVRGEALAVGPGKWLPNGTIQPMTVKAGDVVILSSKFTGTEVELHGEKVFIVREEDCLGVEEKS